MKKGFWAAVVAIGGAVIAAFLYAFTRKPTPVVPTPSEKAAEDIQKIQNKTEQQILTEDVTPAQKEQNNNIVEAQVDKAMQGAAKYRRRKQ